MPSARAARSAAQAERARASRGGPARAGCARKRRRSAPARARPKRRSGYIGIGAAGGAQLVAGVEARLAGLARPDQLDDVAARAQVAHRALDGQRDAVELGRIGLGDVGDAHRAGRSVHRAILASGMPACRR